MLAALGLGIVAAYAHAGEVLLANVWNSQLDPGVYWVSEKLDGVRAVWDGKQLHTRNGNLIQAPDWFVVDFPKRNMDGELWMGRGRFEEVAGAIHQEKPDEARWRQMQYRIFELPDMPGDFSARVAEMHRMTQEAQVPWLTPVLQFRVANAKELREIFNKVVDGGGEGLMLHRADAVYMTGRSDALLKLKPFDDAEAKVTAHFSGKGRNSGRLGALEVLTDDGMRFRIGSGLSDAQRVNPPPVGSIITYRHTGLTHKGLPRFPRYLRVRLPE
ncbi:MAG: DNA ligase [Gallionellaceae bacterium]